MREAFRLSSASALVVLIEHQSSISGNLPIRLLMYIARIYEKILDRKKLYEKKLVKIPRPEFIVLYNGRDKFPEFKEYRLSTAFMEAEGLMSTECEVLPLELPLKN